ncbi:MAG: endonuclease/exonuclease/phosphatase family protein [Tannerellaceae bacterium]|nr:endonuclease/exonuclease/phosphatase family protein [Tannerellaceae bacterium]
MSFNIWVGGGYSIEATADVIVQSNADIVGIQESSRDGQNIALYIADSLGWPGYAFNEGQTVISKFPIVRTSPGGHGVKIQLDETHFVWMFNIHLAYCPYEPYQLNGIEYCGAPLLSTANEAIESAKASRGAEVAAKIADVLAVAKEGYPVFLTGDFNEPSCLDWTLRATAAGMCKLPVEWPSTKAFMEQGGLKDVYRTCYPDEVTYPGHTWTSLPPTEDFEEVHDRIDFLFSGATL